MDTVQTTLDSDASARNGRKVTTEPAILRANGLRVTQQREAVLGVLADRPHASAADVAAEVNRTLGTPLSRQGLYNVLADLTRAGLLRCIEPAGSAARYELRVGDNHHHLVCRSCGRVEDIDCAVGTTPCLQPASAPHGFRVDEAEVTWWGLCRTCATARPTRTEGVEGTT
jgi:Fur family transcriptional regulator, stress-responsive regulator